jgi:hypothetical protein
MCLCGHIFKKKKDARGCDPKEFQPSTHKSAKLSNFSHCLLASLYKLWNFYNSKFLSITGLLS